MRCSAAGCLWTVAEADIEERRRLAELMSATTFVDFITSVCGPVGAVSDNNESNELLVIGAQGIQVTESTLCFNFCHIVALHATDVLYCN